MATVEEIKFKESSPAPVRRGRLLWRVLLGLALLLLCAAGVFYWRPLWVMDEASYAYLWLAGVRSEYVHLGPYRIHYFVGGEGKPLVLVHGLGGKAQNFTFMIPSLMRHGFRVYAPDLLGYGDSDRPDVDYSMALEADILRQFLDSQGLEKVDLGGWSMGGWVALKLTADHPERVHRLFLADSAGIYFKPAFPPTLFHPNNVEEAQRLLGWLTPQADRIPRFMARDLIREMHPTRWVVDRAVQSMESGKDLMDDRLASIQVPVLIIWGKQDILIPLSCGEEMKAKIPNSSLVIFNGCGHLAPVECSGQALRETLSFLSAEHAPAPFTREFAR